MVPDAQLNAMYLDVLGPVHEGDLGLIGITINIQKISECDDHHLLKDELIEKQAEDPLGGGHSSPLICYPSLAEIIELITQCEQELICCLVAHF